MENSTLCGQVKISINDIYQIKQKSLNSASSLSNADRLGGRFSKNPVTYRALKRNSWNYDSLAMKWYSIKDGAYHCYCAYVLRISRYSDFLSPVLTNTGIFLLGLKLSGESRS